MKAGRRVAAGFGGGAGEGAALLVGMVLVRGVALAVTATTKILINNLIKMIFSIVAITILMIITNHNQYDIIDLKSPFLPQNKPLQRGNDLD